MGCSRNCVAWSSLIVGIICLLISIIGFILFPILRNRVQLSPKSHYVVIDAGSSASKIYSYYWEYNASTANTVTENFNARTEKGITYYSNDLKNAGEDLLNVINQSIIGGPIPTVPLVDKAVTPLQLGATAGVRLFEARSPAVAAALMDTLRAKLQTTGLLIKDPTKQIHLLTGPEEALSGWIASNYLMNTLKRPNMRAPQEGTIGALEIGGASAQISFVTSPTETKETSDVTLYGHKMKVYRHSFLCFGQDTVDAQIRAKVWVKSGSPIVPPARLYNPCLNSGNTISSPALDFLQIPCFSAPLTPLPDMSTVFTFVGTGVYEECKNLVQSLFDASCTQPSCSFNNVYQPKLPDGKFLAMSAFYYVADFFKATDNKMTLTEFRNAVKAECEIPWTTLQAEHPTIRAGILSQYCFMGLFIDALLGGFGFTEARWKDVVFANKINGATVSWALGFLLKDSSGVPPGQATYVLPRATYTGLMVMSGIILAIAVCFCTIFVCIYKRNG